MYKLIKSKNTNEVAMVLRTLDYTFIPFDLSNSDYQKYLEWVAEGNTPEPADE